MLSNLSLYPPQGLLLPQFSGLQPGAYNGTGLSGQEFMQNPFAQNQLAQNPLSQSPFAPNPYLLNPWAQGQVGYNPLQNAFSGQAMANIPAQHIVPLLGQLAQQLAFQNAVTQQIGIAVQQLTHHLAQQTFQGGLGAGQGPGGQAYGAQGFGAQGFSGQFGGYGGFGPQPQGWGGNRSQTIQ